MDERVDPDAIASRIRERAERTKRRQVDVATAKLDDERQQAVEMLCERVTAQILDGPLIALDVAAEHDDPELARAVAKVFDVEDPEKQRAVAGEGQREALPSVEQ